MGIWETEDIRSYNSAWPTQVSTVSSLVFVGSWTPGIVDGSTIVPDALHLKSLAIFYDEKYRELEEVVDIVCKRPDAYTRLANMDFMVRFDIEQMLRTKLLVQQENSVTALTLTAHQAVVVQKELYEDFLGTGLRYMNERLVALDQTPKISLLAQFSTPPHKNMPLYFVGDDGKRFKYTVHRSLHGKLRQNLIRTDVSLNALLSRAEGATYLVENVPQNIEPKKLKRLLLPAFYGLKHKMSREKLNHYPLNAS